MNSPLVVLFFIIVSVIAQEMGRVFWAEHLDASGRQRSLRHPQNPFKYIDIWGTLIIPTVSYLGAGIFIGFAKQFSILISSFRYGVFGKYIFLSARIVTSTIIAVLFALVFRFAENYGILTSQIEMYSLIVQVNVALACFMLLPLPGFDGFQLLKEVSPRTIAQHLRELETRPSALIVSLLVVFFFIAPLISMLVKYIVLFLIG